MSEAVYFVQNETTGAIKIGYSTRPQVRISSIRLSTAEPLATLAIVAGSRELEGALHQEFDHLHIRGEWFRDDPSIHAKISELKTTAGGPAAPKPAGPDPWRDLAGGWLEQIEASENLNWRQLSRLTGINVEALQRIKYRRSNAITVQDFMKIKEAYTAYVRRQISRCETELEAASARLGVAVSEQARADLARAQAILGRRGE